MTYSIESTQDWTPDEKLKLLLYGRSKSGKTFGALSFPRPCVMDFDRGIATARNPAFIAKYGLKEIIYAQFQDQKRNKRGVVEFHNAFDDGCKFFDEMMKQANIDRFDTWIVDTGTTVAESAMNKALVLLGGSDFTGGKSNTLKEAKAHGLVLPKLQDYGSERSMSEQFFQMVIDSGKNVVLLCHEKEIGGDGPREIVPLLTGKGVEAVCLKFDEIYNLKVEGNARTRQIKLLTDSDGIRIAGSRYGVPSGIDWDYETILAELTKIHTQQKEQSRASNSA